MGDAHKPGQWLPSRGFTYRPPPRPLPAVRLGVICSLPGCELIADYSLEARFEERVGEIRICTTHAQRVFAGFGLEAPAPASEHSGPRLILP